MKTGQIAFLCVGCGGVSVYHASQSDGRSCAHCGGFVRAIGFAKVENYIKSSGRGWRWWRRSGCMSLNGKRKNGTSAGVACGFGLISGRGAKRQGQ